MTVFVSRGGAAGQLVGLITQRSRGSSPAPATNITKNKHLLLYISKCLFLFFIYNF